MNNNIKRAICIVAATATFVSMFGCTIKSSKNSGKETTASQSDTASDKKKKGDGAVMDYSSLSEKDGTAVYTFKFKDDKNKEYTRSIPIILDDVDTISIVPNDDIESDRFLSGMAKDGYKMSDEKAKEVAKNKDKFKEFQFIEYVQNTSDKRMAYREVAVENNGVKDIWIKTTLGEEATIAPGSVAMVYVHGIADMSKYDSESLNKAFKDIDVKLVYTLVNSAQDDIDWENADTKTIDIH